MIIYQDIYTIFLRTRLLVILKIKLRKIIFYIFKLEVISSFKCYGRGTMRVGLCGAGDWFFVTIKIKSDPGAI